MKIVKFFRIKNSHKGTISFVELGIIIGLIIIIGESFLIYKHLFIGKNQNQSSGFSTLFLTLTPNISTTSLPTQTLILMPTVLPSFIPSPTSTINSFNKYEDDNFGYAFYYPKSWKILSESNKVTITNLGLAKNDTININEVQDSKVIIKDVKVGDIALFFNNELQQWAEIKQEKGNAGLLDDYAGKPAEPAFKTISQLSVFSFKTIAGEILVIPLSHTRFLLINYSGDNPSILNSFASAIIEISAHVSINSINNVIAKILQD